MIIRHLTDAELQARIDGILAKYPWMADYPADCDSCASAEIASEHGYDAADSWDELRVALSREGF